MYPGNLGSLSKVHTQGISTEDPPPPPEPHLTTTTRPSPDQAPTTKTWFSLLPQAPRPPPLPGQTTASFSAPLLTSLSLCEGKVQSCILLNGKWCVHRERDGPLSLQLQRGATGRSPAPLPLPGRHHGKQRPPTPSASLNASLVSPPLRRQLPPPSLPDCLSVF